MKRSLPILIAALLAVGASEQGRSRSTADGVYTSTQAEAGFALFVEACQNCHAPTQHSLPPFRARWFGRSLGDLFGYLRREMPQTDPGTLTNEEYATLVAYILRINGLPPGPEPLSGDSATLTSIRIDSVTTTGRTSSSP